MEAKKDLSDIARLLGSEGGKARAKNLSPARKREIAAAGGAACAAKLSKKRRQEIARNAARVRVERAAARQDAAGDETPLETLRTAEPQNVASALAKARAAKLTAAERQRIASVAGKAGGAARAKALSKKRRQEIARAAVQARWDRVKAAE